MRKVTKELLKEIANNLNFEMSEEELEKLLADFEILDQQFSLLNDVECKVDK